MEIVTAPYAVLVDALSFVASGFFLLRIRTREVRRRDDRRAETEHVVGAQGGPPVRGGGNPNLRAQAGCTATSNLFSSLAFSIFLVFAVRELGLSAAVIGLVFSVGRGVAARSVHGPPDLRQVRDRPDLDRDGGGVRAVVAPRRAGTRRQRRDPLPDRGAAPLRVHRRRLQHRPGQLPAGDLPAAPAGPDELRDALHRLGDDPGRHDAGGALATWIGLRETIVVGAVGGGLSFLWLCSAAAAPA